MFGSETSEIMKKYKKWNMDLHDSIVLIKLKAYELYARYIENNSEYQVNISYEATNKINEYFQDINVLLQENITIDEIYKIFIPPIKEIKKLLQVTFLRFQY